MTALEDFLAGLRTISRPGQRESTRTDAQAGRAERAASRGSGHTPISARPPHPAITTPMVTLAWQVLDSRDLTGKPDERASVALAQTILKAAA